MYKQSLASGIVLVILPLLGFPPAWKTWIIVLIGLGLIARYILIKKPFWHVFIRPKQESPENTRP